MVYFCLINKLDPKLAKNDIIKINTKSKEIDQNVVISINTCRVAEIKSNTQNEQTTFISNKFFWGCYYRFWTAVLHSTTNYSKGMAFAKPSLNVIGLK
jgi:hypothetical protein